MNLRLSVLASFIVLSLLLGSAEARYLQAQDPTTAQQGARGSITGIVRAGADSAPLPQASVTIVGTSLGVNTGPDGRYVIPNVSPGIHTIQARRLGFSPTIKADIRVAAGQATTVNFVLQQQALILTGVVTTGVSDPTSGTKAPFSVAQVSSEKLQVASTGSPLASLAGKVAGMSVRPGGGPGSNVIVQLRNPLSVSGFTQPMIIIDGVIQMQDDPTINARGFNGNPLDINPENIESIEVVRGAAAAAIYGQRAANGVINIKTKRGTDLELNTAQFSLNTEMGISQLGNKIPLSRYHRFMVDENNQFIDLFGRPIAPGAAKVTDPDGIVDNVWGVPVYNNVDALFRTGTTQLTNATLSQSTLTTNFNVSAGAANESGVLRVPEGGLSRHNLGVNLDYRAGDKMQVGFGLFYNRQFQRMVADGDTIFQTVLDISPDIDIRARDPLTRDYLPFPDGEDEDRYNPLYFEPKRDEWEKRIGVQASASATYRPTSILSFSVDGGYQRSDRQQQLQWIPRGFIQKDGDVDPGQFDIGADLDESFNTNARANLLTGIGGWTLRSFVALGGQVQKQFGFEVLGDSVFQLGPDIDFTRRQTANQNVRDVRQLSVSGSVAFDYNAKYIVDLVYRHDGSSLLPPESRWRGNGRVSLAWSMAEEAWWPFANIPLFKPRYSIGTAGNNPVFDARYETYLQNANTERIFKQNMGNNEIVPEEVREQEFGLDFSFQNKYGFSLTYVRNNVKNSIRADTILSYTGFDTQQRNLGDLRGDTYEATVEAQWLNRRDLRWSSTLVMDRSRQTITRYPRRCANPNTTTTLNRECEGYVFGQMYGFYHVKDVNELSPRHVENEHLGWFDVNDDGYVVAVGENGSWTDQRWGQNVVVDGITYAWGMPIRAGVYDDQGSRVGDRTKILGQGLPDVNIGLGNQVQYGRWNLHVQLVGQVGGKIFNRQKMRYYGEEQHTDLDQLGKPDYAKKPFNYYNSNVSASSGSGGLNGGGVSSTEHFIEDGDFLKMSELRLAYRFDQGLPFLRRLGMTAGSVALVGRNLFTLSGYSGYDPEIDGTNQETTARVDDQNYPSYRTVSAQFRIVF